jgi:hypothetical protein
MTRQSTVTPSGRQDARRRRPAPRWGGRYSYTRDAWVLHGVGHRWGPVFLDR